MRTVLMVDVHNFYVSCSRKFNGQVVNYTELSRILPFQRKIAYGRQAEDKVQTFAKLLRNLNFEVRFGGGPYNIEMALSVAEMLQYRAVDHLVIGSGYFEMIHIHQYCYLRGIQTTAIGFNIPEAFGRYSDIIELGPEHLMDAPNEVSSDRVERLTTAEL